MSAAGRIAAVAPLCRRGLSSSAKTVGRGTGLATAAGGAAAQPDARGNGPRPRPDPLYPGTAVERTQNAQARVLVLREENMLSRRWVDVRRALLWAGGLRDLPNPNETPPGHGFTGHCFNDFNHVDLVCMTDETSQNSNDGELQDVGVARGNFLGEGIRIASAEDLGPGGSWTTCANGCHLEPPQDVAHVQYRARVAFKLVWVPNEQFDTFVLVDDDGKLLATGRPRPLSELPPLRERQLNYALVKGSKYAVEAEKLSVGVDENED